MAGTMEHVHVVLGPPATTQEPGNHPEPIEETKEPIGTHKKPSYGMVYES